MKEMCGFDPAKSATLTKNFFIEKGIKNIVIPGIGCGCNIQIFRETRRSITGIEISVINDVYLFSLMKCKKEK